MNKLFYISIYTKHIQIFRLHIEIFFMVVCLLGCSGLIPDIDLQGTEYMNDGVVIFQFNCSSNIGFKGCTVEGILDNRTHDNIRYTNNECFHKDGKCTLECCKCSSDCKFFIWNVTILNKTVNNSFGCQSRIETNGITYKAMVFIRHNSNGFTISNKSVDPIKGYKPIITIRPSISDVPSGTKTGWKISTLIILPVLLVVSIVLCIIICRCVRQRKKKYKVSKKTNESMSSHQNEQFQERNERELPTHMPPNSNTVLNDTERTNVDASRCAGFLNTAFIDTEQPRFPTASASESESNRISGRKNIQVSSIQSENLDISVEKSEMNWRKLKKQNSYKTEKSAEKFEETRWKKEKHKSNVTDIKKRHTWDYTDSKRSTRVWIHDIKFEDEHLLSKESENGEDMDIMVDQNSPNLDSERRRNSL